MASRFWAILCLVMVGGATSCGAWADHNDRGKENNVTNIVVNNASELKTAIAAAKGGETFILAPGDYGEISINNKTFAEPITIRSQNLSDIAHLDKLSIAGSKNIIVNDLDVGGPLAPGEANYASYSAVRVSSSDSITLQGLNVHGQDDGIPTNDRMGMYILSSSNVNVLDSEFSNLQNAIYFNKSNNIVVSRNDVHDIRNDGFDFSQVQNVTIEGNKFYDWWRQTGDHSDAIQFWTANTTAPSTDILIKGNQIYQGGGTGMQGIFMGDELKNMPFARVAIENNLIYQSGEYNGLNFNHGTDINIIGNSILTLEGNKIQAFLRIMNVDGGVVKSNVANVYIDQNNTNVEFRDNVDFSKNPGRRNDLPSLDDIRHMNTDGLIMPGVGYQKPTSGGSGPVSEHPKPDNGSEGDSSHEITSPSVVSGALGEALATQLIMFHGSRGEGEGQIFHTQSDLSHSQMTATLPQTDTEHHLRAIMQSDLSGSLLNAMAANFASQTQIH